MILDSSRIGLIWIGWYSFARGTITTEGKEYASVTACIEASRVARRKYVRVFKKSSAWRHQFQARPVTIDLTGFIYTTHLLNMSFSLATVPSLLSQNGLPETQEPLAIFRACGDLTHGIRRCSGIAHSRGQFHESYSNPSASQHRGSTQSV